MEPVEGRNASDLHPGTVSKPPVGDHSTSLRYQRPTDRDKDPFYRTRVVLHTASSMVAAEFTVVNRGVKL